MSPQKHTVMTELIKRSEVEEENLKKTKKFQTCVIDRKEQKVIKLS